MYAKNNCDLRLTCDKGGYGLGLTDFVSRTNTTHTGVVVVVKKKGWGGIHQIFIKYIVIKYVINNIFDEYYT